jgi:hypothetical protein
MIWGPPYSRRPPVVAAKLAQDHVASCLRDATLKACMAWVSREILQGSGELSVPD